MAQIELNSNNYRTLDVLKLIKLLVIRLININFLLYFLINLFLRNCYRMSMLFVKEFPVED